MVAVRVLRDIKLSSIVEFFHALPPDLMQELFYRSHSSANHMRTNIPIT